MGGGKIYTAERLPIRLPVRYDPRTVRTSHALQGFVVFSTFLSGCAHGPRAAVGDRAAAPAAAAAEDPTARLIATADGHVATGIQQARAGHLSRAREEFDRAVDLYVNAPRGAFATPALGEAYRRTLETIHVHELQLLAAGDGFTERLPEPAAIDTVAALPMAESAPSAEVRKVAEASVGEIPHDLPITINDPVLAAIDLYRGGLRDWFTAALARGGRYLPKIRQVFASEGVPQDLAYAALVESAFKPQALSRARAKGVWQFIPETGTRFGLKQDWWVDERSDPEKATRAAARYLKWLHEMFGDWNLALAGYNAGEGKVLRALSRHGASDFWQLAAARALPRETKNYVPMIHAAIVVAKAPERYGFAVEPEPILDFDTVAVSQTVDLRAVAECAETTLEDVQFLNPELRRMVTPANRRFEVKVPRGRGPKAGECIDALPPERRAALRLHVVARGETLASIARRYGVKASDLATANGLKNTRTLGRGRELIIPTEVRTAAARPARPAPAAPATVTRTAGGPGRISYTVKAGDTLGGIAEQYSTTVKDIQKWNGLRGTRLALGQPLTIYTPRKF